MPHYTIAIDAMGGDHGPSVTVPAAVYMVEKYPHLHLVLTGLQQEVEKELDSTGYKGDRIKIHHTSEVVAMDESPSQALRTKKDSSMRVSINLVKEGVAKASVSAGNTGALMATARFVLKMIKGIDRPAIMATLPTKKSGKEVHLLDLGANVDSSAEHLYQFAVMGSVTVSALDNLGHPRVGLLNIGEEEIKGNEQVKKTAQLLSEKDGLNYIGYVEGDDIFSGDVDVVVCDGFVGNIILKAVEGIAVMLASEVKKAFLKNIFTRLQGLFAWSVLSSIKKDMDPNRRNGASLLGLNGIVIKSHGGASTKAFSFAIRQAMREIEKNITDCIGREVAGILKEEESK